MKIPLDFNKNGIFIDTRFYNELRFADISFAIDLENHQMAFNNQEDYNRAIELRDKNRSTISDQIKSIQTTKKKGRLF